MNRYNRCSIENCNKVVNGRGLCKKHYTIWRKENPEDVRERRTTPPKIIIEADFAKIPLTKGLFAIIDIKDIELVSNYIYQAMTNGYAARRSGNKIIYLHQDIKGKYPPGMEIDHEDRNRLNNRRKNLVFKTYLENLRNTKRYQERLGVGFDKTHWKWKAYIDNPGQKRINIGTFSTREEASLAVSTWRKLRP